MFVKTHFPLISQASNFYLEEKNGFIQTNPSTPLLQQAGRFYVADLDTGEVAEISRCAWECLDLRAHLSEKETRTQLSNRYSPEVIQAASEELEALQKRGQVFDAEEMTLAEVYASSRPCLFIPQSASGWFPDIQKLATGTNIAIWQMVEFLTEGGKNACHH